MELVVGLCLLWLMIIAIHANRLVVRLDKLIELMKEQHNEKN